MGELYDEDFFKRSSKARRSSNFWMIVFVILLIIVAAAVFYWKWKHNPDTMIVDINKASAEELQYLPEVGPAVAKAIVSGRPYSTPEDLKKVKGIGEKTYEKMRPRVKVE